MKRKRCIIAKYETPGVIGEWRSLVAHLTGGQVAAGSNPVSPTKEHTPAFCVTYAKA